MPPPLLLNMQAMQSQDAGLHDKAIDIEGRSSYERFHFWIAIKIIVERGHDRTTHSHCWCIYRDIASHHRRSAPE